MLQHHPIDSQLRIDFFLVILSKKPKISNAKLLQKSEMRKDIVIELSYKGFG